MEDRDGRIAVCNRAFCELFPLVENPGELVGRRREEVLTEVRGQFDDGDAMLQRIDAILQRGEPVIGERVQLADGRVIERDCLPIRVGELRQGVLWTFRDISSRIRMERSLAAEKERLRVTLLSIGDAVISTDASGRIDFLNPAAEALTGWRNEDTTGRRLSEVLQLIDPVLGRPRPDLVETRLEAGAAPGAGESVIVARDGQERVVEHASSPIRDAVGDISGTVVVLHDATDRYRMAVLYGASAGFLIPFGYQTHLMVYSPGRYRMMDFVRVGLPVSIAYGATVLLLVPVFFPFTR